MRRKRKTAPPDRDAMRARPMTEIERFYTEEARSLRQPNPGNHTALSLLSFLSGFDRENLSGERPLTWAEALYEAGTTPEAIPERVRQLAERRATGPTGELQTPEPPTTPDTRQLSAMDTREDAFLHRLDSIARLAVNTGICNAVYYDRDSGQLLLADNGERVNDGNLWHLCKALSHASGHREGLAESSQALSSMAQATSVSELANGIREPVKQKIALLAALERDDNPDKDILLRLFSDSFQTNLQALVQKRLDHDIREARWNPDTNADEIRTHRATYTAQYQREETGKLLARVEHLDNPELRQAIQRALVGHLVTKFRPAYDHYVERGLHRVVKDLAKAHSALPESRDQATYRTQFLPVGGNQEVHAEMKIIDALFVAGKLQITGDPPDQKIQNNTDQPLVIGVTKRCCPDCIKRITALNELLRENGQHEIMVRGAHATEYDIPQAVVEPEFMKHAFIAERVQQIDRAALGLATDGAEYAPSSSSDYDRDRVPGDLHTTRTSSAVKGQHERQRLDKLAARVAPAGGVRARSASPPRRTSSPPRSPSR